MVFWILSPRSSQKRWNKSSRSDLMSRMAWKQQEREVKGEIMRTDIFIQVFSETRDTESMEADLDRAFRMFRDFESRFSRFREESELSALNRSSVCRVSDDLLEMILLCREYFVETDGVFDPTILPILEREGYRSSFGTEGFGVPGEEGIVRQYDFSDIQVDRSSRTISKPSDCRIDLGGIGKGYIVDRVARMLLEQYRNFIVDAGGDMYLSGGNRIGHIPYFVIDIEDLSREDRSAGTLLLSDRAVATSGVNRRRWQQGGVEKSHLVHPEENRSVSGDILTVTIVDPSPVRADIMAKTLCILGRERGKVFAKENRLPAFFLLKDGTIEANEFIKPYLWENDTFSS